MYKDETQSWNKYGIFACLCFVANNFVTPLFKLSLSAYTLTLALIRQIAFNITFVSTYQWEQFYWSLVTKVGLHEMSDFASKCSSYDS